MSYPNQGDERDETYQGDEKYGFMINE